MQIVIDIDENLYTRLFDNGADNYDDAVDMAKAIRKGTQLTKGHGRLVDENDLSLMTVHMIDGVFVCNAPTIIEADREREDYYRGAQEEY